MGELMLAALCLAVGYVWGRADESDKHYYQVPSHRMIELVRKLEVVKNEPPDQAA